MGFGASASGKGMRAARRNVVACAPLLAQSGDCFNLLPTTDTLTTGAHVFATHARPVTHQQR